MSIAALMLAGAGLSDIAAADPSYLDENGWWAPTALLYQGRVDEFLDHLSGEDTPLRRLPPRSATPVGRAADSRRTPPGSGHLQSHRRRAGRAGAARIRPAVYAGVVVATETAGTLLAVG